METYNCSLQSLKVYLLRKKTSKIYIVQSAKIPTWILKEDEKDFI